MNTETNSNRGLLLIICVLLAALLATNVYSIIQDFMAVPQSVLRAEEVDKIRIMLNLQSQIAGDLMTDYQDMAYGNESIERITEQQLIAAETQIAGLELIAFQNQIIAELLLLPYTEPSVTEAMTSSNSD